MTLTKKQRKALIANVTQVLLTNEIKTVAYSVIGTLCTKAIQEATGMVGASSDVRKGPVSYEFLGTYSDVVAACTKTADNILADDEEDYLNPYWWVEIHPQVEDGVMRFHVMECRIKS